MLETFMNERYSIFENDKQVASGLTAEEMLAFCKEHITDETKRLVITLDGDQETADKITEELCDCARTVNIKNCGNMTINL